MLCSGLALLKHRLLANDGAFGEVEDLLFDDRNWVLHDVVVNTGQWLRGRKVLIPPASMGRPLEKNHDIPVSLSKKQVKDSPLIESDQPVSLRMEAKVYRWWAPVFRGRPYGNPAELPPGIPPGDENEASLHLRSINEVRGYQVFARDGCAGLINHFEIDDDGWIIRYFVVDPCGSMVYAPEYQVQGQPPTGQWILIAAAWVKDINWSDKTVAVDVSREQIENSPQFDPTLGIERSFEWRLHDHYRRQGYW